MKKKADRQRRSAFRQFYKTYHDGLRCYYCGDMADTIDHVPSINVAYSLGIDQIEKRRVKLLKVKACQQCNSILGDRAIMTLDSRAKYVYQKLQERHKRILSSPEWEDEDLNELGPILRSYVLTHHDAKNWIENRLQYMEDLFYDVLADQG